jgi:hypothetical protein
MLLTSRLTADYVAIMELGEWERWYSEDQNLRVLHHSRCTKCKFILISELLLTNKPNPTQNKQTNLLVQSFSSSL